MPGMRRLYGILVRLAAPLAATLVLIRGLRNEAYREGFAERFGFGGGAGLTRCIWLHAVSLGEVTAAAALVRGLQRRHPSTPILVTTATPTGRAKARSLFGSTVTVRYLPYDTPGAVARFLRGANPCAAIVMETELWPNLLQQCARRGVPVVLASARLSTRSVSTYRRFGSLFRDLFTANVTVAAQSSEDADRFALIGAAAARIHVVGNVKFDIEVPQALLEQAHALRLGSFAGRPIWIAGSTHAGEEQAVLAAHRSLLPAVPAALLILAPRHPDRFGRVAATLDGAGLRWARRSAGQPVPAEATVLLLDSIGELGLFYGAADIAFVGGSLVPVGGHNLLEPAALGVPVLTGPSNDNGREIAAVLSAAGAALIVADAADLAANLIALFGDAARRRRIGEAGRAAVYTQRGSVGRLLDLIDARIAAAADGAGG